MSVQILLIAAVVSTVAPVEMRATPRGPIEFAVEQHRRERVAQAKRDTGVCSSDKRFQKQRQGPRGRQEGSAINSLGGGRAVIDASLC